jgi:hypothetical protein
MRNAIIAAFLLVLGSMVLGATVLREPLANAASPFTNVIIGNDTSNAVPVRQQGTVNVLEQNTDAKGNIKVHDSGSETELVATAEVSPGHSLDDVDVSQYREIRLASAGIFCTVGESPTFIVDATETIGGLLYPYRLLTLPLCNSSGGSTFASDLAEHPIEVPGRTLSIKVIGTPGNSSVTLGIFGRTN